MLTACSGPAKDAEYKDINDLGTAYEQAVGDGMTCSETEKDIHDYDWVQTTCGPTGIIMLFTSDARSRKRTHSSQAAAGSRARTGSWKAISTRLKRLTRSRVGIFWIKT